MIFAIQKTEISWSKPKKKPVAFDGNKINSQTIFSSRFFLSNLYNSGEILIKQALEFMNLGLYLLFS